MLQYVEIDGASFPLYASNTSGLYLSNVTVTNVGTYGLYNLNSSNTEVYQSAFSGGTYGVYANGGGVQLKGTSITGTSSYGLYAQYATYGQTRLGGGGDPGNNVISGTGSHGIYASGASVLMGEENPYGDPYAGYNSVYSTGGKRVHAVSSSTVVAQLNWWGTASPTSSLFYVDGTSSIDWTNYLTSDPNGGSVAAPFAAASTEPSGQKRGRLLDVAHARTGDLVRLLEAVRLEEGRREAARQLAEVMGRGGPHAALARALRLSDLLHIGEGEELVREGEHLLRGRNIPNDLRLLAAHALFSYYTEEKADAASAHRVLQAMQQLGEEAELVAALESHIQGLAVGDQMQAPTVAARSGDDDPDDAGTSVFPNPFSSSTTFTYALAESVPVRLEVFDALGRRVALLVDEVQGAGAHEAVFEAADLPSGVYVWRLRAGEHTMTRKVLRVR